MSYTKGEWKATDDGYVYAGEKYVHEPNNFGYEIKPGSIIPKEVLANTQLISAAPDMYQILKGLMNDPEHFSLLPPHYKGAISRALAKATLAEKGGQQ